MNTAIRNTVGVMDVAAHCGVSASTVCRALNGRGDINDATRQKVLDACRALGYTRNRGASNLRLKRTDTVTCLLPAATNEMSVEKVFFLKQAVLARGFRFRQASFDSTVEAEELLSAAIGDRPAGVILGFDPSAWLKKALANNGIAAVCYDCASTELDSVTLNRAAGLKAAVAAMIAAGRKRIVLLGGSETNFRGRAYTEALAEAGFRIDPRMIIDVPFGRNLFEYGYEQGKNMIGRLKFDGVQCVNDACAIGLIRALSERSIKVPADVSVAGFDDIMVSRFQAPALSTVSQPKEAMAAKTAELLFNRMERPESPAQHITLETTFIPRESV